MSKSCLLIPNLEDELVYQQHYRAITGCLMFLTCLCARFQATPKVSHMVAAKRILIYLKGAPKLGLWYLISDDINLYGYTDNDFGGCNINKKSTLGASQFLGGRILSWQFKKQA